MIDPLLYPDVVRDGNLAEALTRTARQLAPELPPFTSAEGPTADWNAWARSENNWVTVVLGVDRRSFVIEVVRETGIRAAGATAELAEVVGVAKDWCAGARLHELHTRFPFMTYSRLAQGYEDGDPVRAQWERVLDDEELLHIRPVLRAAYADDRLRELFPTVTHLTLARFQVDPRHDSQVRIEPARSGGYRVSSSWDETGREVPSIPEAIDAAVAQLPDRGRLRRTGRTGGNGAGTRDW